MQYKHRNCNYQEVTINALINVRDAINTISHHQVSVSLNILDQSIHLSTIIMKHNFYQLKDAVESCTSFTLEQSRDEDREIIYILRDGCGDADGDPFEDLVDVEDYITNNDEVHDYLMELN